MILRTKDGREFNSSTLQDAYHNLPKLVIEDLAVACGAGKTAFAETDRDTCRRIGQLDIWEHINKFLGLTQAELEAVYRGRGFVLTEEEPE
jgi:hypothetical protein